MKRPSAVMVLVLAGVAGVLALLIYGVASQGDGDAGRLIGDPAPEIELPPLEGGSKKSLDDWHGQVVVLNYWASWCEPCREESPLLERWHQRLKEQNATVLGVNALDVTSDAKAFIAEYELTYPHLRDKDGSTQEDFGITGYPETFVIARDGRIGAVAKGPVTEKFMREKVEPLVREN